MPSKKDVPDMGIETEETMEICFDDLDEEFESADDALETIDVEEAHTIKAPEAKVPMSLSSIESLITEVDDKVEYLTWVIYGKNGTGKTTILSTVDGMLILAFEDGTLSIREKAKDKAMKVKIDVWDKVESVYWLLKRGKIKDGGIAINTAKGGFIVKSIGFDTVTKEADVCMRNIVLGDAEKDPDKDVLKKTMKNWGDMSEKLKYWMQLFKELPIQKVWLCQEGTNAEDVDSDEFSIFPQVNKSVRTYIMSEADVIARTYIAKTAKGVQFRLSAAPNDKFVTKDRTNKLGVLANPSLSQIYKLVFGKEI